MTIKIPYTYYYTYVLHRTVLRDNDMCHDTQFNDMLQIIDSSKDKPNTTINIFLYLHTPYILHTPILTP